MSDAQDALDLAEAQRTITRLEVTNAAHVARVEALNAALREAAKHICRHCRNEDGMLKAARHSKQPGQWFHDFARGGTGGGFFCDAPFVQAALEPAIVPTGEVSTDVSAIKTGVIPPPTGLEPPAIVGSHNDEVQPERCDPLTGCIVGPSGFCRVCGLAWESGS